MRKIVIATLFLALSAPAFAADPAPAKPTCGKTAEDCQKVVDAQALQITTQAGTIKALQQQRNSIRSAADDAEVVNFIAQQQAAQAAATKK